MLCYEVFRPHGVKECTVNIQTELGNICLTSSFNPGGRLVSFFKTNYTCVIAPQEAKIHSKTWFIKFECFHLTKGC